MRAVAIYDFHSRDIARNGLSLAFPQTPELASDDGSVQRVSSGVFKYETEIKKKQKR